MKGKAVAEETKMYKDVCKPQFEEILRVVNKTNKKLFESNGERALVELVRDNAQEGKRIHERLDEHISVEEAKKPKTLDDWLRDSGRGSLVLGLIYLILREHGVDISNLFLP